MLQEMDLPFEVVDPGAGKTIDEIAAKALSSVSGRLHIVGLSMGGYIALSMTRQAPPRIASLTLIGTSARADTDRQRSSRLRLIEAATRGDFDDVVPRLTSVFLSAHAADVLRSSVEAMIRRVGSETFVRQQFAISYRPDARPALPATDVPAIVICGTEDAINPPEVAEEIVAGLSEGKLKLILGAGHLCNLEDPVSTNSIISGFLKANIG